MSKRRAIIVGCNGQDGRILWDQLAERNFSLVGIGRNLVRSHDADWNYPVDVENAQEVHRLVGEFQPEQVYYLAAYHHSSQDIPPASTEIWQRSWQLHIQGLINFFEAIKECHPATRMFYASSSRIFGIPVSSPQTEDTPFRPICLYGISKATGMMLGEFYRQTHKLKVSNGILYNHESVLRGRQFVSQRIAYGLASVKAGRCDHLEIGDLNARVDWGYAPDYTEAMQLILEHDVPGEYIISSGTTHSIGDLVDAMARPLQLDWHSVVVENPAILRRDSLPVWGNSSRLRKATGWQPRTTFSEMSRILVLAAQADLSQT